MAAATPTLISADAARALLAPVLARHLAGADLAIALDRELALGEPRTQGGVLVLPDGTALGADLSLDESAATLDGQRVRGVIALGRLDVAGDIVNASADGGAFLVALGALRVRHILKGGAPLMAIGPLRAAGTIYCAREHGSFRAWGGVTARAIIIDDQLYELAAPVDAIRLVMNEDDPSRYLLPELLWEDEDGGVVPMDGFPAELTARIRAGAPIFRTDAPWSRT